ncbi:hypothetical protein AOLI_G00196010 [Acnodon oligacanthus]
MFYGFLHLSSAVLLRWRCRVLQGLSRNAVKAAGLEAYRQIQNIGLFLHLCWLLMQSDDETGEKKKNPRIRRKSGRHFI